MLSSVRQYPKTMLARVSISVAIMLTHVLQVPDYYPPVCVLVDGSLALFLLVWLAL